MWYLWILMVFHRQIWIHRLIEKTNLLSRSLGNFPFCLVANIITVGCPVFGKHKQQKTIKTHAITNCDQTQQDKIHSEMKNFIPDIFDELIW